MYRPSSRHAASPRSSGTESDRSPGQISSVSVVTYTDLDTPVKEDQNRASIDSPGLLVRQETTPSHSPPEKEPAPEHRVVQPLEEKKDEPPPDVRDVKLIRFNVPYLPAEVQSLTPRQHWEPRVKNLESLLELEKGKVQELHNDYQRRESEVEAVRTDCRVNLANMEKDVAIAQGRHASALEKIKLLEAEIAKLVKEKEQTVEDCNAKLAGLKELNAWLRKDLEEQKSLTQTRDAKIGELTASSARLAAKLEEAQSALASSQRQYESFLAKANEERKAAREAADSQGAKLVQTLKENEANFAKYQQFSSEAKELRDKLARTEAQLSRMQEENTEMKIKLGSAAPVEKPEPVPVPAAPAVVQSHAEEHKSSSSTLLASQQQTNIASLGREITDLKEKLGRAEYERDSAAKDRLTLEKDLDKERAAKKDFSGEFSKYKRRSQAEMDEAEGKLKQYWKQIMAKDAEISDLKSQLEAMAEERRRYQEACSINSYLRNLPTAGIWADDASVHEGVHTATIKAVDELTREKSASAVKQLNEEVDRLHEDNKKTIKRLYNQNAEDVMGKREEETANGIRAAETRVDDNLSQSKKRTTYLTEFK